MSGLSSNAIASDTRPLRPKMQRRPAATYGTKARRIARPAASQIQSTPAEASIGTASKPVTQSDDEDDDIKEPPAKRVQRATRAFTVARDAVNDIVESAVASTSSSKPANVALRNKSNLPSVSSASSTTDKYLTKSKSKIPQSDSLSSLDEESGKILLDKLPLERLSIAAVRPDPSNSTRTSSSSHVFKQPWALPIEDENPSDRDIIATSTPSANKNRQFTFTFPDLHAPTIPFLGDDTHTLSDDDDLNVDTTVRAVPQGIPTSSTLISDTHDVPEQSMLLPSESNSTTDDELATMTNRRMGINHTYKKGSTQDDMPIQEASDPITESEIGRTDEEEDGFASNEDTQKTEKQVKEAQLAAAAKKKQNKLRRKSKSKSTSPENYRSSSNSSVNAKESKIKLKSAEKKKRSKVAEGAKMEIDGKSTATSCTRKTRSSSSVSAKSQAIYGTGTSSTTKTPRAGRSQSTTSSASSNTIENKQGLKMRGSKGSLIRSTPVKAHSSGSADELGF